MNGGWSRWSRHHEVLLDWVVLVVASATATAGGTVGLAYARVVGWSAACVAGILALLVGGAAVAVTAYRLVRRTHRWWRLSALPIALVVVAFVVYPVFTAVCATAQPRARLGEQTPADRGREYRDVTFSAPDGVALSGWYLPSSNGAAVALLHGSSSTRSAVLDHAVVLNEHGYGVLLFDARGHGRSGGEAMDLGWSGDLDMHGAVDYLAGQADVDPARIAVVGLSMGGEEAIGALAADQRLRAAVAEGAQNRTFEDRDDWLPGGVNGWLQRQMDRAAFALTDLLTSARRPISLREAAHRAAPRPILLIAGTGEATAARSIQLGAPRSVTIWETGTGHTRGLATDRGEWIARVTGFLDTALTPLAD